MNPAARLTPVAAVDLAPLFPGLYTELMTLLRGLSSDDWSRPTACALWSVKDIVAHLVDGCLRRLSFGRDRLDSTPDRPITSYADLVSYLNELNARWVVASRRLSSAVLLDLLDFTEPQLHRYFSSLDPKGPARFGVAWAGEEHSANWFDIGREYTERWLHQQQIREAVGAAGLTGRPWLYPALDIFVRALPFTYMAVEAPPGTAVEIAITGEAGGVWTLVRESGRWTLHSGRNPEPHARVTLDQETAWKLFSKGLRPEEAGRRISIQGDTAVARPALGTLAIMG